jgi:hypothetical protein
MLAVILITSVALWAPAAGQGCVGAPAQPGQVSLAMRVAFHDETGHWSWGPDMAWNLQVPVALQGFVDVAGGSAWPVGTRIVYDLPFEASGCAVVGAEYRAWPDDREGYFVGDNYRLTLPFGLGAGTNLGTDSGITSMLFVEMGLTYNVQRDRNYWAQRGRLGGTVKAGRYFGGVTLAVFDQRSTWISVGVRF